MGAAGDEAERGFGTQPVEHCLQPMRRAVEIEGVGGADDQVNLAVEVGLQRWPVASDDMRDVVMLAPIGGDGGVDPTGRAVEQRAGASVGAARREHPVEARELAAIGTERRLELCKFLQRRDHLALVADQRQRLAVGADIGVGVRRVDVDIGEIVEIARVGRCRPGAAENLWIGDLEPQRRPAA